MSDKNHPIYPPQNQGQPPAYQVTSGSYQHSNYPPVQQPPFQGYPYSTPVYPPQQPPYNNPSDPIFPQQHYPQQQQQQPYQQPYYGAAPPPPGPNYNSYYGGPQQNPYDASPSLEDGGIKILLSEQTPNVRLGFVRKVYSILTTQILLTTLVGFAFWVPSVKLWIHQRPWFILLFSIISIVLMLGLMWKRHHHPTNYVLLTLFTLCEAIAIGGIASFYNSFVVLQAALLTLLLFISLTLFTLQSRWDFSGMGPFLFVGVCGLMLAGVIQLFFPFGSVANFVIAIITALIFCGYVLFDTYNIFNRMCEDEYIVASVELYMDIINLFLALLRILDFLNSNNNN